MKLGEAALGRVRRGEAAASAPAHEAAVPDRGDLLSAASQPQGAAAGVAREIRARRRIRRQLRPGSPVYLALLAVTLLMELDLWLFGWMRCGSYFIVVEKPD